MATIKAIEGRSVHQIQSGQVIVDLISVVKELVENSLDAGATSVEIRFKNQGLDSIEVQDNGKGIPPDDFETVALKHYTSKLSTYEDLTSLDTFGFRGEALSSLCALSKFHITTARAEDGAVGKKLEFETSGKLKGNSVVAAQKGTTVSVEDLFCNLPVRRKELEKNIKREYNKVIAHLHAYACISVGVRFSVTNQMSKGKKVVVFSTKSNTTTKENITNVFGAKTLVALVKLDLHLEMEPSNGPSTQSARNWSTQSLDRSREVHVQGYISKPVFGEGRQAPDRQMFFVNSRPCGLPQVTKAVNEVYRSFNVAQMPFVFANLIMDTNAYDVNVSPDKRSIMLHDQTALLESLKKSLTELFEQAEQTVPMQSQLPNRKLPSYKALTLPQRASAPEEDGSEEGAPEEASASEDDEMVPAPRPNARSTTASNGTSGSLIERWAGRESETRREAPVKHSRTAVPADKMQPPTPLEDVETQSAAVKSPVPSPSLIPMSQFDGRDHDEDRSVDRDTPKPQASEHATLPLDTSREPDPMGSPYDDLFSQRPARLSSADGKSNGSEDEEVTPERAVTNQPSAIAPISHDSRSQQPEEQSEIVTVNPASQKATPGPVQNAFDRMRPMRTPLQTAEITIGDKTTTTVIGSSPPYKKRRVHQPANSQSIAQFGGSPLLARGLRSFAAPGSQLHLDSSAMPPPQRRTAQSTQASDDDEDGQDKDETSANADAARKASVGLAKIDTINSDIPTSDPLDALLPSPADEDEHDEDYVDEEEKKIREDEKIARLIQEAEIAAAQPSEDNLRRASQVLKNGGSRKESTLHLAQYMRTSIDDIREQVQRSQANMRSGLLEADRSANGNEHGIIKGEIDDAEAETKLSLSVSKTDFERMQIIGQFNLGFILAVRPSSTEEDEDQLFIIDQHAADEKYNYERLQRTVTLQNQRLVRPKPLELTAIEEEIILNNADALKANGFEIETTSSFTDDDEGESGRRCRLITLPISGQKTFDLSDLEELLHLLSEAPAGSSEIPRPKKVQKMLAMRACRSSIMVGKNLTVKQMGMVVKHMGEMGKPWNCPHGRPTMRHLAGLGSWEGWQEGDAVDPDDDVGVDTEFASGRRTDWKRWLEERG
ncbi:ATP-binding mismatch repair protein [Saxophila tyrrhenica]|uniref:DNA mismatch repair protein PMS1 n=1 Tax=Saxophila tyrrhenica TaxID=1690608 RepID=A0AAV9PRH8_9PEZI|nr:ATP-binding mismatch repair protein [Saxophila tyrrhenica]